MISSIRALRSGNLRNLKYKALIAGITLALFALVPAAAENAFHARPAAISSQPANRAPVVAFSTSKRNGPRPRNQAPVPVFQTRKRTSVHETAEADLPVNTSSSTSAAEENPQENKDIEKRSERPTGKSKVEEPAPQLALLTPPVAPLVLGSPPVTIDGFNIPESSIPQEEMDLALKPLLHRPLSLAELKKRVREALLRKYREHGIRGVQVLIPPQEIKNRELLVNVIEPKLGKILVEGNHFFAEKALRRYLKGITTARGVLVVEKLEDQLRRANRHPDRQVAVVLKKGEKPGETDVVMQVRERKAVHGISPLHVSTEIANTGAKSTGRQRVSHSIQYTNALGREHIAGVNWQYNPESFRQVQAIVGSYQVPGRAGGPGLTFYGGYSDVEVPTFLNGLELFGKSMNAGFLMSFDLPKVRGADSSLSLGLEWSRLDNSLDFAGVQVLDSSLDLLPATARYSFQKRSTRGATAGSVSLKYNLGGVTSLSSQSDMNLFRSGASADFVVVQAGLQRLQRLGNYLALNVDLRGQYSPSNLVPAQQYHIGGRDTVRGYERSEVSGDQGFVARVEIQGPPMPGPLGLFSAGKDNLMLRGFFDYGTAWLEDNRGRSRSRSLAGAGIGARYLFSEYFEGNIDLGTALKDSEETGSGDLFLHFDITLKF